MTGVSEMVAIDRADPAGEAPDVLRMAVERRRLLVRELMAVDAFLRMGAALLKGGSLAPRPMTALAAAPSGGRPAGAGHGKVLWSMPGVRSVGRQAPQERREPAPEKASDCDPFSDTFVFDGISPA